MRGNNNKSIICVVPLPLCLSAVFLLPTLMRYGGLTVKSKKCAATLPMLSAS